MNGITSFILVNVFWFESSFECKDGTVIKRPSTVIIPTSLVTDMDKGEIIDNINQAIVNDPDNTHGSQKGEIGGIGIKFIEYIEKLYSCRMGGWDRWYVN